MCNENTEIQEYEEALVEAKKDLDNLWEYVWEFANCLGTFCDPNQMLERLEKLKEVEKENTTLKGRLLLQIIQIKELENGEVRKEEQAD